MTLKVGDRAPEFTLLNTEKEEVSLKDFAGSPLVILFFPFAFTDVCTNELCTVRDMLKQYGSFGIQVVGISVDSPFTLEVFKEKEELNFPLLSDFNKEVSQKYGAFYEEFVMGLKGVAKRSAFVVDDEGIIQYAEVLESAGDLPNIDAIKKVLMGL